MTTTLTTDGRRLATSWRDPLGRAGIATRGVLYLVLGFLAIQFARGKVGGDQVNQTGAFETVGAQPFGKLLLVLMVVGLAALALFRIIQACVGDPVEGDEASDRVEFAGKALIYAFLTATAIKVTIDAWSGSAGQTAAKNAGDQQQQRTTSTLFDLPGGRFIVAGFGLALIGVAVYHMWHHAVQASFMERLAPRSEVKTAVETCGRVGYAARSVVFAVSGVFFLVAAVQYDPNESKGLSGSLQELAQHSWGRVLLWATALGLFAFGLFCLAEARYRKHS
jgi:hypothetical protein